MVNINQELCDSVMENDINEVIKLINKGANLNYYNGLPLFTSIKENYYELTKLLINENANININEGSLLVTACGSGNSDIVKLLLDNGINYNGKDSDLIRMCIYNDDSHSLAILIQNNMAKIFPKKTICMYGNINLLIFDACVLFQAANILQFIIDNYPKIIPNNIHKSLIKQKDVQKYNFIKMLINRNLIDIPD